MLGLLGIKPVLTSQVIKQSSPLASFSRPQANKMAIERKRGRAIKRPCSLQMKIWVGLCVCEPDK